MLTCILVWNQNPNQNINLRNLRWNFFFLNTHIVTLAKYAYTGYLYYSSAMWIEKILTDHNVYQWNNMGQPFGWDCKNQSPLSKRYGTISNGDVCIWIASGMLYPKRNCLPKLSISWPLRFCYRGWPYPI